MKRNGFTLVELLIVIAIIGLLSAIVYGMVSPTGEARLIACQENMSTMRTMVVQAEDQTWPYTPTWEEVQQIAGNRWDDHFHYVPNAEDTNNGHGNDLDICDDGNPGVSGENRDCLDIRFIIVCDHDHQHLANYSALLSGDGPMVFGGDPEHEFVKDLNFFSEVHPGWKDPNFQKWVGRY